jgi:hypothetical protein
MFRGRSGCVHIELLRTKPAQGQADGSAPTNLVRILNEGHEITTIGDGHKGDC